ncbi:MAG: LEA type 2 family protein [Bacteroidales bacterium]|nr:LEA type 2 family protein [Bacteroidales bacterium]
MNRVWTIVFLVFTFFLYSCEVKEVEVGNLQSFNINEITKEYIEVVLAAPIKNPNNFGFTISDVDLDITFNGIALGKINKVKNVKIDANSDEVKHLVFRIQLDKLAKGGLLIVPSLLTNRAKVEVHGYVKARKFLFNKKIPVDYNKTTKISKQFN